MDTRFRGSSGARRLGLLDLVDALETGEPWSADRMEAVVLLQLGQRVKQRRNGSRLDLVFLKYIIRGKKRVHPMLFRCELQDVASSDAGEHTEESTCGKPAQGWYAEDVPLCATCALELGELRNHWVPV